MQISICKKRGFIFSKKKQKIIKYVINKYNMDYTYYKEFVKNTDDPEIEYRYSKLHKIILDNIKLDKSNKTEMYKIVFFPNNNHKFNILTDNKKKIISYGFMEKIKKKIITKDNYKITFNDEKKLKYENFGSVMKSNKIKYPYYSLKKKVSYDYTYFKVDITYQTGHMPLKLFNTNTKITKEYLDEILEQINYSQNFYDNYVEFELSNDLSENNFNGSVKLIEHFIDDINKIKKRFNLKKELYRLLDYNINRSFYTPANFDYLNKNNMDNIIKNNKDYIIRLKLDGLYNVLYFSKDALFFGDITMNLSSLDIVNVKIPEKLQNSFFEVEMLNNTLYIINIIILNGKNMLNTKMEKIHEVMDNDLYDTFNNFKFDDYKTQRIKSHILTKKITKGKLNPSKLSIDGYLVMNKNSVNNQSKVYKLKHKDLLTVDLLVLFTEKGNNLYMNYFYLEKMVNSTAKINNYFREKFSFLKDSIKMNNSLGLFSYEEINKKNIKKKYTLKKINDIDFKKEITMYDIKKNGKTYTLHDGIILEMLLDGLVIKNIRNDKTYRNYKSIMDKGMFIGPNGMRMINKIGETLENYISFDDLVKSI